MSEDKELGVKETAARIGISERQVSRRIKQGPPEGLDAERRGPKKVVIKLSEADRNREYWREKTRE